VEAQKGSIMKAVAAALVLIAGAAVVLWYGNTLNSWVLGGLIGGLAALLLSIPISLTVFSYLSKRHDECLQAEEQEEQAFAQENYAYQHLPAHAARRPSEVEGYVITEDTPEYDWQEEQMYSPRVPRALPAPAPQRQGNVQQNQTRRNSESLSTAQQGAHVPNPRPQQPKPKGKETAVLRATPKKINVLGGPTFEPTSQLSQHRSEALRVARLEAAQQRQDSAEDVSPVNNSKRGLSVRPNQALAKQNNQGTSIVRPRPTRQLPQQTVPQPRQRRIVDSVSPQPSGRRTLPTSNENTGAIRRMDPSTDSMADRYPQTGPLRRSSQSGQNAYSSQEREQRSGADSTTGNVNKPLVRRAPYMYEDDPLRQELAQQLEAPTVRRSSRFDEDEENE